MGIRQAYPIHPGLKKERKEWDNQAIKGLTYLTTDRGYQRAWIYHIGRKLDSFCGCGTIQNTAHPMECRLVGGGRGRAWEALESDLDWCREVWKLV